MAALLEGCVRGGARVDVQVEERRIRRQILIADAHAHRRGRQLRAEARHVVVHGLLVLAGGGDAVDLHAR